MLRRSSVCLCVWLIQKSSRGGGDVNESPTARNGIDIPAALGISASSTAWSRILPTSQPRNGTRLLRWRYLGQPTKGERNMLAYLWKKWTIGGNPATIRMRAHDQAEDSARRMLGKPLASLRDYR